MVGEGVNAGGLGAGLALDLVLLAVGFGLDLKVVALGDHPGVDFTENGFAALSVIPGFVNRLEKGRVDSGQSRTRKAHEPPDGWL